MLRVECGMQFIISIFLEASTICMKVMLFVSYNSSPKILNLDSFFPLLTIKVSVYYEIDKPLQTLQSFPSS